MNALLYRPIQVAAVVFALLLLLSLGILGALNHRNSQRLDTIRDSIQYTREIQAAGLTLVGMLVEHIDGKAPVRRGRLEQIGGEIAGIAGERQPLVRSTPATLARVGRLLADGDQPPDRSLTSALELMRQASYAETGAQAFLAAAIDRDARSEQWLALGALFTLPGLLLVAVWLLRRRIFNPIDNLKDLLSRLAEGEFTPVPLKNVDLLVLPLLDNYNRMVARLEELERTHRQHAATLEAEVRAATHTLLQQSHSLARAERLAAVGELAASVAHELRNPLAGIQLALANVRHDLRDEALAHRLDLVLAEQERVTRLLNALLAKTRHAPETARTLQLGEIVEEVLALTRYQAPPNVILEARVPEPLRCRLPEGQLRQALLNLVLNAIQAMDGKAGRIVVAAERESGHVRLSVSDDGPGFPEAVLREGGRAFVSTREAGTGLGLALVRRFACDAGGTLELINRQPRGACATLLLPYGAEHV